MMEATGGTALEADEFRKVGQEPRRFVALDFPVLDRLPMEI